MICSVPGSNSGLNWLDRLRTSKGFPVGNELGLEAFLDVNPQASGEAESSGDRRSGTSVRPGIAFGKSDASVQVKAVSVGRERKEDLRTIISCVLADLFNMNDRRRSRVMEEKKRLRKQRNPRFCTISSSANMGNGSDANTSSSAAESPQNSVSGTNEKKTMDLGSAHPRLKRKGVKEDLKADDKEEEGAIVPDAHMYSYSCTEVTVIDSSCPGWKSEKTIFRKGDDWRVRDGRQRSKGNATASANTFRKKRRLSCKRDSEERPSISVEEDCTREATKES